jgi:hypothetical protein
MTPAAVLPREDENPKPAGIATGQDAESQADLCARNVSLPDATGYSTAYAGESGFYTEIIFRGPPAGLAPSNPSLACGSI